MYTALSLLWSLLCTIPLSDSEIRDLHVFQLGGAHCKSTWDKMPSLTIDCFHISRISPPCCIYRYDGVYGYCSSYFFCFLLFLLHLVWDLDGIGVYNAFYRFVRR